MDGGIFVQKFHHLLILSNLCAVYLPGFPLKIICGYSFDMLMIYCSIFTFFAALMTADNFFTSYYLELPMFLAILVNATGFSYLYSFIRRIFYLTNVEKIRKIYKYYSKCMVGKLWPEILDELVQKSYKSAIYDAYRSLVTIALPQFIFALFRLIFTKTSIVPSSFEPATATSLTSGYWVLVYQSINVVYINLSWALEEAFIYLLFKIIYSEYEYLSLTLRKIVAIIYVDEDGITHFADSTLKSSAEFNNLMNLTRRRLAIWIDHHSEVMRTFKQLEVCFWPLMCGQFVFLTISMCGLLFIANKGFMPFDLAAACGLYIITRIAMIYRLCRLGDSITQKSSGLALDGLSPNWMGLPRDVVKTLLKIGESTKRPAVFSIKQLLPVNSPTFLSMMSLQYKLLAFLQNSTQ